MRIYNQHLIKVKRMRVSEGRNLTKGLRLDRNEKVDLWPKSFVKDVLKNKPNSFFSTYPEIFNLYKKIAKFNKVDDDQVLVHSGIDEGIKNIFHLLTKPGDIVGFLSPTYLMYEIYSKIFKVKKIKIGYNSNYKININQLNNFFKKKPKILFFPNPNQPIESSINFDEMIKLAKKCKSMGCILVFDEAYYLLGSEFGIKILKKYNNVVVLRTFSKAFGLPSIRAGYTIANKNLMKILSKARIAHELSSFSIAAAEYLLDNYRIVKNYLNEIVISRNYVLNKLKNLEADIDVRAKHGNYVLINLKTNKKAKEIVNKLKKKFIYVKGPYKKPWDSCICITVGPKKLMEKFLINFKKFI